MEKTVLGVYVIQKEGVEPGDDTADTVVLTKGVEVLCHLETIGIVLCYLVYCLNLSYPPELQNTAIQGNILPVVFLFKMLNEM